MGYGIYLLGEIHVTPPVTRAHQKQLIEQSSSSSKYPWLRSIVWKFATSTVLRGYNRPGSENKGLFKEPLRKIVAAGKKLGYTFNGRMEWEGEIVHKIARAPAGAGDQPVLHKFNQSKEECRLEFPESKYPRTDCLPNDDSFDFNKMDDYDRDCGKIIVRNNRVHFLPFKTCYHFTPRRRRGYPTKTFSTAWRENDSTKTQRRRHKEKFET
jgi:hypothetical protein